MKVEILVPKSLSEITLGKYMRYAKLETKENKDTTFLMQKCVEIFCELDLQNIATIRYKSLLKVIEHINTLFNGKYEFKNKFKMNGVEYGFIPVLDDISMGEYIDLDNYFSDWDNMHKAMSVLYRPVTHSKDDRYDIEPYNGTERSEEYKNMPMDVVMGSFIFFLSFKQRIVGNYTELFGEGSGSELDQFSSFGRKWGWYQSIYALAQGDVTRFKHITKLKAHECLTMLTFMKDKNELEARQIKNNTR